MRRGIALVLVFCYVWVGGLPVVADRPACSHVAERAAGCDFCHTQVATDATPERHDGKLSRAARRSRIECGCGCRRGVDSLPERLTPHTQFAGMRFEMIPVTVPIAGRLASVPSLSLRVPRPPPESSSLFHA